MSDPQFTVTRDGNREITEPLNYACQTPYRRREEDITLG